MTTVLLLIHLLIAVALIGVVLLQRSEGGGLGIGGGGGSGFMTGRGTANLLTRATAGLAAAFFVTSIGLTILARQSARPVSPLDAAGQSAPAKGGVLDSLDQGKQRLPSSIPKSD
jgi:preprotein translocase subunit SecG